MYNKCTINVKLWEIISVCWILLFICLALPAVENVRTRLLALHLLEVILPAHDHSKQPHCMHTTVHQLFDNLTEAMWCTPLAAAKKHVHTQENDLQQQLQVLSEDSPSTPHTDTDDLMAMQEASFDPDKTLCCKVEHSHTLVHGSGGRGYGLGATSITSGCYQWKVSRWVRTLRLWTWSHTD